jgi:multiple sugar transport system substrate-binding protein
MTAVTFLAPDTDAYVASVERHAGEFRLNTGHDVQLRIIGSDEYFSNDIHRYLTGDDAADVYMSGPVLLWQHVAAGLVEPLDDFVEAAAPGYAADDFMRPLMDANRWTGRFGDPLGRGPLLEIPVNCESYNLAYVPEVLERHELDVPTTWDAFFRAANRIAGAGGGLLRGFGQRGVAVWHTMYTGYATQFWSSGATDFDATGKCVIASPAGVEATTAFIDGLRSAGPRDWTNERWYELALDFAKGAYGLMVDSDHYVAFFENPETSQLVGRIGYALPPEGPTGVRKPNLWTWSVVMNSRSRDKQAAWDFMEWATGREFLLRSAFEGNMNPTRASIWDDPAFVDLTRQWGDFARVSRSLVEEWAGVLVTPMANYLDVGTRWTQALREAYLGTDTVKATLTAAARDIERIASR